MVLVCLPDLAGDAPREGPGFAVRSRDGGGSELRCRAVLGGGWGARCGRACWANASSSVVLPASQSLPAVLAPVQRLWLQREEPQLCVEKPLQLGQEMLARGQSAPQRDTGWRLAGFRVLSVDAGTATRNRSRRFFALGEGEVVKDTTRGVLRERSSHGRPV